MIDAGFQDENCLAQMEGVLKELDISYEDLFLTHKHHDHSGLASVYADRGFYMNPLEERHHYDCVFYSTKKTDPQEQDKVLHSVGVKRGFGICLNDGKVVFTMAGPMRCRISLISP